MKKARIITPTGHLGLTPLEKESFLAGCAEKPDFIVADSGSSDIGPRALGADQNASPAAWQKYDLEVMLLEARRLDVPMIVGSACDAGTDRGVDSFVAMVHEIAGDHGLAPFKLSAIYAEQRLEDLSRLVSKDAGLKGLDGRGPATADVLRRTDRAVAVMGAQPIQSALSDGADVVIAGRSADICLFAAPLLNLGFDPGIAYYTGKVLECASYCAEPFMGKETVLATITDKAVTVTPLHPGQRCSRFSIINQTLYERTNPFREHVPGGYLDISDVVIEEQDDRTARITGPRFVETDERFTKIEGAGKVGERRLAIIGLRDPNTIGRVDEAIAYARDRIEKAFGANAGWTIHFHFYGRNGVLGPCGRDAQHVPHEIGVVVEVVDADGGRAHDICAMAIRQILMARLPGVAGGSPVAAAMAEEILIGEPGYVWTLNHLMPVDDFVAPFRFLHERVNG